MRYSNEYSVKWVVFLRIISAILIISIWEILGRNHANFRFALGTPLEIVFELKILLLHDSLLSHFFITGLEAGLGLLFGVILGSAVGLSFWFSKTISEAARPIFLMAANAPVFALAPLLVIWFGVGIGMKVALAFYFTFFLTVSNTHEGVEKVSKELVEMYDVLVGHKQKTWNTFRRIIIPGALDSVFSAMRKSVALALLGAFVGEFISSNKGLGYLILRAAGLFNVPRALAAGIAFITLAVIFDWIGKQIQLYRANILQFISVNRTLWKVRK